MCESIGVISRKYPSFFIIIRMAVTFDLIRAKHFLFQKKKKVPSSSANKYFLEEENIQHNIFQRLNFQIAKSKPQS